MLRPATPVSPPAVRRNPSKVPWREAANPGARHPARARRVSRLARAATPTPQAGARDADQPLPCARRPGKRAQPGCYFCALMSPAALKSDLEALSDSLAFMPVKRAADRRCGFSVDRRPIRCGWPPRYTAGRRSLRRATGLPAPFSVLVVFVRLSLDTDLVTDEPGFVVVVAVGLALPEGCAIVGPPTRAVTIRPVAIALNIAFSSWDCLSAVQR